MSNNADYRSNSFCLATISLDGRNLLPCWSGILSGKFLFLLFSFLLNPVRLIYYYWPSLPIISPSAAFVFSISSFLSYHTLLSVQSGAFANWICGIYTLHTLPPLLPFVLPSFPFVLCKSCNVMPILALAPLISRQNWEDPVLFSLSFRLMSFCLIAQRLQSVSLLRVSSCCCCCQCDLSLPSLLLVQFSSNSRASLHLSRKLFCLCVCVCNPFSPLTLWARCHLGPLSLFSLFLSFLFCCCCSNRSSSSITLPALLIVHAEWQHSLYSLVVFSSHFSPVLSIPSSHTSHLSLLLSNLYRPISSAAALYLSALSLSVSSPLSSFAY